MATLMATNGSPKALAFLTIKTTAALAKANFPEAGEMGSTSCLHAATPRSLTATAAFGLATEEGFSEKGIGNATVIKLALSKI